MRLPILSLFLIAAALLGEMQAAIGAIADQLSMVRHDPTKWTLQPISCYYTSREQCMTTLSGHWRVLLRKPVLPLAAGQDDGAAARTPAERSVMSNSRPVHHRTEQIRFLASILWPADRLEGLAPWAAKHG